MPAQFAYTLKALAAGAKSMTPAAAVKNIEVWENHLESVDVPGTKGLLTKLGKLKRLLQAESLDGSAIAQSMVAIAGDVTRMGKRVEGKRAEQVQELAVSLETASSETV